MDSVEAIKRIEDHMRVHKIGEYPHIFLKDALDIALEALKKQIPLKPTTFGKNLFDCAFCGRVLEKYSHNYCPKCGHKLDWE